MQVNVSQLLREAIGATRDYQINEVADITGDGKENTVQGECHLLRTQRSILVKCTLNTEMELSCSRCLGQFPQPLIINFEEEYVPTVDVVSGASLPRPEEASTFTIDEHHVLDLTEAIRQYAVMAIPMKPLCDSACSGLCPVCGQDLNQGSCTCPEQDIDPRWSELNKLL